MELTVALEGPHVATEDEDDVAIFCDINITPLTDVILVLLIIFMVSSSAMVDAAREGGHLDVTLPQAGQAKKADAAPQTLVVTLTADHRLFAQGRYLSQQELTHLLGETFKEASHTHIVLDADGALAHREVVALLDLVRAAGFVSVSIGADTTP